MTAPWGARTECPRCGAPVEVGVGDPVLACPFCRTPLYLCADGPLCYRLAPGAPGGGAPPLYLPFWRFRGLRYRVLRDPPRVEGALLDATVPAVPGVPREASLGIRPQVAPLRLEPRGAGAFPRVATAGEAVEGAEAAVEALHGERPLLTRLVGETAALVLAPFALESEGDRWWLREAQADGARYPLSPADARAVREQAEAPSAGDEVFPLALRCPECGHDLPGFPGSVGFLCGHCARAWEVRGRRFSPLSYAAGVPSGPGARCFPFWEIAFEAEGLGARSRADLRRWAVPWARPPAAWERQPCTLLVPGFKAHPRSLLRLARIHSLAEAEPPAGPAPRGRPLASEPVRLPLAEAAQALKLVLADLGRCRRGVLEALPGLSLRVTAARLLFLPFRRRHGEWVEERTGSSLPAATAERGAAL